ncbi:MAG TPA: hypothetical protein VHO91_12530 [Rhodopila sp.]|nr:hypothetical protein [Rhodopila sp.]
MLTRRPSLSGLFAVLLALAVQLGLGSSMPRPDPLAQIAGLTVLCHPAESGSPTHAPAHMPDCQTCPLCAAVHMPTPTLGAGPAILPPAGLPVLARAELPPPGRAPPPLHLPPIQPRAPPPVS